MDGVDPLRDSRSSRYAVESDDSEDELGQGLYPSAISDPSKKREPSKAEISLTWSGPTGLPLVIAIGNAGKEWTTGLSTSQSQGGSQGVLVDGIEVGIIQHLLKPDVVLLTVPWTLPGFVSGDFAKMVIDILKPCRFVTVDSYATASYISPLPTTAKPPIRYLQTRHVSSKPNADLFAAPNLMQGVSAAFVSLAEMNQLPGTLMLLPSSRIPPPLPAEKPELRRLREEWERDVLVRFTEAVVNVLAVGQFDWDISRLRGGSGAVGLSESRKGDIGDGGMYI
jgi:hypothetical protein